MVLEQSDDVRQLEAELSEAIEQLAQSEYVIRQQKVADLQRQLRLAKARQRKEGQGC